MSARRVAVCFLAVCCLMAGAAGLALAQTDCGALSPTDALAYMQETERLLIVDVSPTKSFKKLHFYGAVSIPRADLSDEEEDARYLALPADRPVLVNCRMGVNAPKAYKRIKELRPDIPEIGYIDDAPLFEEYNAWRIAKCPQQLLGAIAPEESFTYLSETPDLTLVVVDATEPAVMLVGALHIPAAELVERAGEIPEACPVLLVSEDGAAAREAYAALQTLRPDCPCLAYVGGAPPAEAYNAWAAQK